MEDKIYEVNDAASESQKQSIREQMINGYQEMAELSLQVANEFSHVEYEAMSITESFLK